MSEPLVKLLEGAELPHRVRDLAEPPERLFLVGELPRGPSVAVVGTRCPTPEAEAFTTELVTGLATAGCSIWSGGALGIDAAAHRAALRAQAKTVVVAPAGWERPYPQAHRELYRSIVESGGAYLSTVPPDHVAKPHHFFARNALLVALSHGVVVVQAGLRSGARNAAKTARRIGRPIFAVPSCPWVHQGLGCNLEISLGARPISSAKDVVKWLAVSGLCVGDTVPSRDDEARSVSDIPPPSGVSVPSSAAVSTTLPESLEGELLRVLDELRKGARNVDEICQRTGWPAAVVQSDVLRLTLYGEIKVGRSGAIEIVSD